MASPPQPGAMEGGYIFNGGNPADPNAWEKIPDVDTVEGGYRFKGGDPSDKGSWEPARGTGGRILDKLTDTATYGPLGMAVKAADSIFGTDGGAALDNLKTGAIKGISGLASLPQTIIDAPSQIAGAINGRNVMPPSQALKKATGLSWLPNQSQVQGAITQAPTMIGLPQVNMRTAQSSGGRLLQDVGQAIGSAPFAPMMGYNLAGGLGSWGGGELSDQNPWAKALGAVGGAGLYGALQQTAPNAVSMIRRRLEQYQPAELNAGEALQREAQARGIQLMPQEVLDRSRSDPMAQLAGTAAVQPQGRPIQQFAAARVAAPDLAAAPPPPTLLPGFGRRGTAIMQGGQPLPVTSQAPILGSIPTAIEDAAGTIGPRVTNPNEAARGLGAAAEAAVAEPQIERAATAKPLFQAARADAVDPQMQAAVIQQIDTTLAAAHPQGDAARHLTSLRGMIEKSQTVGQFDEALDKFRSIYKANAFEGSPIPDAVREAVKPVVKQGYQGLEATNPSYQAGREIYAGTTQGGVKVPSPYSVAVEQAQASPAARIAQSQTNPASEGALGAFDNAILRNKLDPAVVKTEIARLNKQNPEAARDALRALIQRHADDAFKITKEGVPPTDSGVGFVKNIAGTDNTRAALLAAVEGVTGNQTTAKGFDRLLEIVQRTGVTPGLGSPTATRGAMMNEAGQGGLIGPALQGANISRGSFIGTLQNWNEMARAGRSWGQIADLFTQPDSLAKLRQLALMNPASEKARALAATILQGVGHAPPATGTPR